MLIYPRIILLIYILTILFLIPKKIIAEQYINTVDACNNIIRFYSISDLQKEIATLEREFEKCKKEKEYAIFNLQRNIDSLNKINDKCLEGIENNAEICASSIETVMQKYKECKALDIHTDKYYNYGDTSIYIKFRFSLCEELKSISISYKKNNLKIDSTFNYNYQNWEVTETDDSSGVYKIRFSNGGKIERRYDKQKRLIYYINIDKKKDMLDTFAYEQYFWENGKLTKTIFNGVERVFIYGTPCDVIKVEPSDLHQEGYVDFNPPPVYNKSFGKIPEEDDSEYEKFKKDPYKYYSTPELLERQKQRCEEYKETQKKKGKK